MINIMNCDCMEFMRGLPDKAYELAIVDVPYGIHMDGGKIGGSVLAKQAVYKKKEWDNCPPQKEYFNELQRVSNHQIIWGANHFISLIPFDSSCWIVWDKINGENYFADCELAWTNFCTSVRKFSFRWQGMLQGNMKHKEVRIHPTQKPVALYKWILTNYAKKGDKILDTHGGSCSLAIACHDMGFDLDACEIDADYYRDAVARYERHAAQAQLFNGDLGYTYTNGAENAQQAELPIEETNQ